VKTVFVSLTTTDVEYAPTVIERDESAFNVILLDTSLYVANLSDAVYLLEESNIVCGLDTFSLPNASYNVG